MNLKPAIHVKITNSGIIKLPNFCFVNRTILKVYHGLGFNFLSIGFISNIDGKVSPNKYPQGFKGAI